MREHRMHEVLLRRLKVHSNDETLNKLRHLRSDHVRAKKLASLGIEDGLHQALRLAERNRLAISDEREPPDLDGNAGFLGLVLGDADGGDLRVAVGAARDLCLVHGMRMK